MSLTVEQVRERAMEALAAAHPHYLTAAEIGGMIGEDALRVAYALKGNPIIDVRFFKGQLYTIPREAATETRRLMNGRIKASRGTLTKPAARELRMIALLASGLNQAEIARELMWSETYLRQQFIKIRGRIGAKTAAHAVAICYEQGWLPLQ